MSFRTRRVLFITPFYMLFEFFLLKYIFFLFGGMDDTSIFISFYCWEDWMMLSF